MKPAGFKLTKHAATTVTRRGIKAEWIERVLSEPESTEADASDRELTHALAGIAEHGNRVLRVIYNDSVHPPRVVTAYFDRRLRGKR